MSNDAKITPDDLQNKLQSFQDDLQGRVDDKKSTLMARRPGPPRRR